MAEEPEIFSFNGLFDDVGLVEYHANATIR